jgi:hypothetical protein
MSLRITIKLAPSGEKYEVAVESAVCVALQP